MKLRLQCPFHLRRVLKLNLTSKGWAFLFTKLRLQCLFPFHVMSAVPRGQAGTGKFGGHVRMVLT